MVDSLTPSASTHTTVINTSASSFTKRISRLRFLPVSQVTRTSMHLNLRVLLTDQSLLKDALTSSTTTPRSSTMLRERRELSWDKRREERRSPSREETTGTEQLYPTTKEDYQDTKRKPSPHNQQLKHLALTGQSQLSLLRSQLLLSQSSRARTNSMRWELRLSWSPTLKSRRFWPNQSLIKLSVTLMWSFHSQTSKVTTLPRLPSTVPRRTLTELTTTSRASSKATSTDPHCILYYCLIIVYTSEKYFIHIHFLMLSFFLI
jgi:hypothetical protein